MQTCFFCGNENPSIAKQYAKDKVKTLLRKQEQMGIQDPVFICTRNLFEAKQKEATLHEDRHTITACMCCHHWIQRRSDLPLPPLPMQNLLWFVLGMQWYDEKKSDKRILLRLAKEITNNANNIYRSLFLPEEITALHHIVAQVTHDKKNAVIKPRSIKMLLAVNYQRDNASSLFVPHKQIADWLRR
jgi:hypothetical protein